MSDQPHETGKFTWSDNDGHRAYGVAFPTGEVAMMWDRSTWCKDERLVDEHMSLYGCLGDVLHANGGELEWETWEVGDE